MLAWVETQLELPAGRSMASLSHSQRCLVEIALAVRCPCEVAVLDEHLTYLDGARLAMAGTLLSQNSAERSNKFIVCTATRLTRSMSGAKAVYALGGAYPTEAREVGSSETLSDELRPAHAPNALKVSFRMNPEGLGNITSTENLRVLSRHEDGLVISVKKSIDAALDDLHEFGLEVIAVEWEF